MAGLVAPISGMAIDFRAADIVDLDTPRSFPAIGSRTDWELRATEIRDQVKVSCGLWPAPEKTPLEPKIFGKIERDGYSVERVYFQTMPGFYLGGNLYRPLGRGNGPFPGVLNPHGHWSDGRMADTKEGSIPARCIQQARMGMVAFSYDMAGYNDSVQIPDHHAFALDATNQLWSVSLMGLQAWNSVRVVDFLASLPDVDKERIGCTGESGGGTQTFILGAIDDRLKLQAPIVMVSHTMQGGCLCENAPGLRVEYSNMEIAASVAPRPQILVGASGDWTKDTMTVEGPSIAKIYELMGGASHFRHTRFDFNHNYNQTSREAVYPWLEQWLIDGREDLKVPEAPYKKEPTADLLAFPDHKMPGDAMTPDQVVRAIIARSQAALEGYLPQDEASLVRFRRMETVAWRRNLHLQLPEGGLRADAREAAGTDLFKRTELHLGRSGAQDDIPATLFTAKAAGRRSIAILANPGGKAAYLNEGKQPSGLARALLEKGMSVLAIDVFMTGPLSDANLMAKRNPFTNFFTTYNRTVVQERTQDIITACAFARGSAKGPKVLVCGEGAAGLWALLAAPVADGVVADADGFDGVGADRWTKPEYFTPGILAMGGMDAVASLTAPKPLTIHHAPASFASNWLRHAYQAAAAAEKLTITDGALSADQIAAELARF
jgi:dienelactone hydrolase